MLDLFYEPIEILERVGGEYSAEMSEEQSAFVCGLIREYRPEKILEIGVAAGGTTAIIMNCCHILGLNSQLYSVDIMENYYRDKSKKTGFLADLAETAIEWGGAGNSEKRRMFRGGIYLDFADEIGNGIDMVIIDTMHTMPGELLDFLSVYPSLKKGCIVILHDICLNHIGISDRAFATKILFDTVTAEKIIKETDNLTDYPNIAAFKITDDTEKHIKDIFSALTITWEYMPEETDIEKYKDFFGRCYPKDMQEAFVVSVALNKKTLEKRWEKRIEKGKAAVDLCRLLNQTDKYKKIYIYGYGKYGKLFATIMEQADIKVSGFVISDNQALGSELPEEVIHIGDVEDKTALFIVAVAKCNEPEIKAELNKYNIVNALFAGNILSRLL